MTTPFELGTVKNYLLGLQSRITGALTDLDGTPFLTDAWQKDPGEKLQGNGITQILEGGPIFERAGCGFSHVTGPQLPPSATQHRPELAGSAFEAMGVSLVFHPRNPYVPTVHMNVRMIAAKPEGRAPVAWFGGGMDLTPYYGIFFDDFSELGMDQSFAMLQSVADSLLTAYMPIVMRRKDTPYGERERDFQLYRRGRYVGFNLVWDRGTHFGLQSGGRTESILLSMPPEVRWSYQRRDEVGSPEERLLSHFLVPKDWV